MDRLLLSKPGLNRPGFLFYTEEIFSCKYEN